MCGIAGGIFKISADPKVIHAMAEAIKHRGPDDEGYVFLSPDEDVCVERRGRDTHPDFKIPSIELPLRDGFRVALAHRRLSVVDLSSRGHQPMPDRSKTFWLTANGEIYNYLELRHEIFGDPSAFCTQTDTEVILEAYKKWGGQCLHKFNGMWAFALWDPAQRFLFCSRDRFGVKPFYYTLTRNGFFFASEIKALLKVSGVPKQVCEETVYDYLACGLLDHKRETFFEHIYQLEPGMILRVDLSLQLNFERWYEGPPETVFESYRESHAEKFRGMLKDAVRLRLRSDIDVGSCLSGGLDSSSIVSLASQLNPQPLKTFSACFDEAPYDERPYIAEVVRETRARGHYVFPRGPDFWNEWPALIYQQEEPFGSTSIYAQWAVMQKAAQKDVRVLLDGQGSDEMLAGYPRYKANRSVSLLRAGDLRGLMALANPLGAGLLGYGALPGSLKRRIQAFRLGRAGFLQKDFAGRFLSRGMDYIHQRAESQNSLSSALRSDFLTYSLPSLFRYEDKNSMAFSIETRHPFVDFRLVEWIFTLDDTAKIDRGLTKRILRDALCRDLPKSVCARRDKIGFATPEEQWLKEGYAILRRLFKKPSQCLSAVWVRPSVMSRLYERRRRWTRWDWRIVNLELWLRVFFEEQTDASALTEATLTPHEEIAHTYSDSILSS